MSEIPPFGFLNINKHQGVTSHDVVATIRRTLRREKIKTKVGHAGTLDPLATGVLVVCIGNATRLSEYVMRSTKQYRATIQLGVETDTYDAEGEIVRETDTSHVSITEVAEVLNSFIGEIEQLPPMYSAVKQGGKKLYELARAGVTVERKKRLITIHDIDCVHWHTPHLTIDVTCSAGTYIRSLAHDIGASLGTGAHLSGLVRTASGNFLLEDSVSLEELQSHADWRGYLITPKDALADWTSTILTDAQAQEIIYGRSIANSTGTDAQLVMAYLADGQLLAVLDNRGGYWKPHKVFLPQS